MAIMSCGFCAAAVTIVRPAHATCVVLLGRVACGWRDGWTGEMYHACWEEVAGFDVVEGYVAWDLAYGVSEDL